MLRLNAVRQKNFFRHMIHCQICQSEARPAKFRSPRLRICQWCVTLLCEKPLDPVQIDLQFNSAIDAYVDRVHRYYDVSHYRHEAGRGIEHVPEPTFFELIFKGAMREQQRHERNNRIEAIANELRLKDIDRVKRERSGFRADIVERALSRVNPPKVEVYGYKNRCKMEDLIDPTLVKYVNAIRFNLLSGTTKNLRLEPEEWEGLRSGILEEDKYLCRMCLTDSRERHVHHIVPLSKYGSNHPTNLITLCYDCHSKVHPDIKLTRHVPKTRPSKK